MRVQDRYAIEVGAIFSHIKDNDLPTTKTLRDKKAAWEANKTSLDAFSKRFHNEYTKSPDGKITFSDPAMAIRKGRDFGFFYNHGTDNFEEFT